MITYEPDIMTDDLMTEKKFTKGIYVLDFFILVGFLIFGYLTQSFVVSSMQTFYLIGNELIGLYLTRSSSKNPNKRIYKSIQYYLMRSTETYEALSIEDPDDAPILPLEEGEDMNV